MSVGADKKQFIKMIDTARLSPYLSAMIPGRIDESDTGWKGEVQRAVLDPQLNSACGLDGKHGCEILGPAYAQNHYCMFCNNRYVDACTHCMCITGLLYVPQ